MYSDSLLESRQAGETGSSRSLCRSQIQKGGPGDMANIIVGIVLVVGVGIALKEMFNKD